MQIYSSKQIGPVYDYSALSILSYHLCSICACNNNHCVWKYAEKYHIYYEMNFENDLLMEFSPEELQFTSNAI